MSSPLCIAVLGVGAIGSTFAFQLARTGGHHVTAIARPGSERLRQLQRDSGIVNTKGERADMRVTDTLDEQTPYDLVIVTLLAHQVDVVLPALRRSAAKRIQFMFNMFDPEEFRDAVGADRSSFGMPFVQAVLRGEGVLDSKIGVAGQKSKMNHQGCVDIFKAAGLPAAFDPKCCCGCAATSRCASRLKAYPRRASSAAAVPHGARRWCSPTVCRKVSR